MPSGFYERKNLKPIIKRFNEKYEINKETMCWDWNGSLEGGGYASIRVNRKMELGHRISYSLFIGEIPHKMVICHKCDNTKCVSPFHLFLVTQQENVSDSLKKGRRPNEKHPSMYSYIKKGCRCEDCKKIASINSKEKYNRKKNKINQISNL